MDLREFTKETITQIVQGANEANETINSSGAFILYKGYKGGIFSHEHEENIVNVEFDVAITTTEVNERNGKAGIEVASIFSLGRKNTNSIEGQTISRIKYAIPIVLKKLQNNE